MALFEIVALELGIYSPRPWQTGQVDNRVGIGLLYTIAPARLAPFLRLPVRGERVLCPQSSVLDRLAALRLTALIPPPSPQCLSCSAPP